jgi:hypothetical protein
MKILISRSNERGTFDSVGTSNRWLFSDITSERGAISRAIQFAGGKAYRIEFFHDERFYGQEKPFRTIEQSAFPGFQKQIYSQEAR